MKAIKTGGKGGMGGVLLNVGGGTVSLMSSTQVRYEQSPEEIGNKS